MSSSEHNLHFFNTETRRKEYFQSLEPGHVRLYTCGPTVYDYAHIGNFRAYVFEDLLRRYLKYRGYRVTQVMNLTDVEDKIIRRAAEQGISITDYTAPYIQSFFEDLDTLNIERAEIYTRATEYIPQMLALIRRLQEKGFTYEKDGSIYFRISSFANYGRLTGIRPEEMKIGARIDADEYEKENVRDFVLWKGRKENEHYWESEFGPGRPGWHIECSAMSMSHLGEQFDIHTGGEDNIFPHHENEIAQSEAATGKKFVNYWLHCRHLMVNGEKMAKSKGNFFTLRDLLQKGLHPMSIRYFLMAGHYRSPLNLTEEALESAHSAWSRIMDFRMRIQETIQACVAVPPSGELDIETYECRRAFQEYMDDDLDTPRALAALFDYIRPVNKILDDSPIPASQAREVLQMLDHFDSVLGINKVEERLPDHEIERLIALRQEARKRKDYAAADAARDQLAAQGIILEDTRDGVRWKRR